MALRRRCIVCFLIVFSFFSGYVNAQDRLTAYVDPFIGTGGQGHTFPGATVPFGMVQLSPDNGTSGRDWSSGYHYSNTQIAGFSHMHLSGMERGDWLDISVMPLNQPLPHQEQLQPLNFSHQNERALPGYYSVKLDNGIMAELTATERVGFHRYSFPAGSQPVIRFDMQFHQNSDIPTETFIKKLNDSTIVGYRYSTGLVQTQRVYFAARTSEKMREFFLNGEIQIEGGAIELGLKTDEKGKGSIAQLIFNETENPHAVKLKVALSMTSMDNALMTLTEIPHWDFNQVKDEASAKWEAELAKVQISTKDKRLKRIFYTALYHTTIAPHVYSDADGTYQNAQGDTLMMENGGSRYTVFSLWDTFRALNPLFTLTQPDRYTDMLNSMLAFYDKNGLLPVWDLSTWEADTISTGYPAIPVLADAILKNWPGLDKNKAFEAMKTSASQERGYKMGDSSDVAMTSGFYDFCIAQVAKHLGQTADYNLFIKRAEVYKATSDTFFVPHDVQGLANIYGGDGLEKKLESFFNGSYAHGDETNHHVAYMYSFLGKPWKTQERVRQIVNTLYTDAPDGYAGNEGAGQMSAWLVWSVAGLYPANPVGGEYVIGSPMADAVNFRLKGGRQLRIIAENNSPTNRYVQSVTFNGRSYDKLFFTHRDLMQGGKITFEMGPEPNLDFGRKPETWPHSMSTVTNSEPTESPIREKATGIIEQIKDFFKNL